MQIAAPETSRPLSDVWAATVATRGAWARPTTARAAARRARAERGPSWPTATLAYTATATTPRPSENAAPPSPAANHAAHITLPRPLLAARLLAAACLDLAATRLAPCATTGCCSQIGRAFDPPPPPAQSYTFGRRMLADAGPCEERQRVLRPARLAPPRPRRSKTNRGVRHQLPTFRNAHAGSAVIVVVPNMRRPFSVSLGAPNVL